MASLADIRRALGANLRLVLPADEGHVAPYFLPAPKVPALQVVGAVAHESADFGGGHRYEVAIEGIFGLVVDRASQMRFDSWIEEGALEWALDSDVNPLTSRLLDDGTIDEGNDAVGTSQLLRFEALDRVLRGQTEVLVATWIAEVWTNDEAPT